MKQFKLDTIEKAARIAESIEDGKASALEFCVTLKGIMKELESAYREYEELAIQELHGEKSTEKYGAKIEHRNGSKRFSFKNLSDWKELEDKKKLLEKQYKALWEQKQAAWKLGKDMNAIDEEGEILELPEVTYSKDTLAISIK